MRLDERGKQCPLPVIDAKKALEQAEEGTVVEVVVDNEIAVQNLKKLAAHKGLESTFQKVNDREFIVGIQASKKGQVAKPGTPDFQAGGRIAKEGSNSQNETENGSHGSGEDQAVLEENGSAGISCQPDTRDKGMTVVLSSGQMGQGDEALGKLLMKGFLYALTQQDKLPGTILLYNGGAKLSCEGSDSLGDLKELEAQGVEILTCGTCLNHYGLGDKLAVGSITNMYEIVERMTGAKKIVRP